MIERSVEAGDVRISYADGGRGGLPLVLLHGGSARWQSWEPVLPMLLPTARVIAPDLRGHGRSGWRTPYYLKMYAQDIVGLVRQRIDGPAILCGHSLGGMVALMAAAELGPAVCGVIVGDAPLSAEAWMATLRDSRARLAEWRALAESADPAPIADALRDSPVELPGRDEPLPASAVFGADSPWFDWMSDNLAQLDPATLSVLLEDAERAAEGYAPEALLPAIGGPILLLQGDPAAGGLLSDGEIARARQLAPQVQVRRLAGVGHALHATHPAPVSAAILEFIAQLA